MLRWRRERLAVPPTDRAPCGTAAPPPSRREGCASSDPAPGHVPWSDGSCPHHCATCSDTGDLTERGHRCPDGFPHPHVPQAGSPPLRRGSPEGTATHDQSPHRLRAAPPRACVTTPRCVLCP